MRWRKLVKRLAVGLAALVVLLLVAGYLLSFTGLYQAWAKELLLSGIEGRLRVEAQLGEVSGNPLYRIEGRQLRLTSQGRPVLVAQRLSLSYFLPEVLLATPVVALRLEGFRLNVARTPEGFDVSGLIKPAEPTGRQMVVSSLRLEGGQVSYAAGAGEAPLVVEALAAEASLSLPASPEEPVVVELRRGSFRLKEPRVAVRELSGTVRYGPERTSLELDVAAQWGSTDLEAKLKGSGIGASLAEAKGSGHLEIERLRLERPTPLEAEGGLDLALAADTLSVSRGRLSLPGAQASFQGRLPQVSRLGEVPASARLEGTLNIEDLARLSGRPQLPGRAVVTYTLEALKRPGGPLSLSVSARSGRATVGGYELDSGQIEATYRPPVLDIARLSLMSARLGSLAVSGPYRPGQALDLDFQAVVADVGPLASRMGAAKIATGSLRAQGKLSGPPSSPAASGTFSGRGLSYGEVSASSATGSFQAAELRAERRGEVTVRLSDLQAKGRRFPTASATASLPSQGRLSFNAQAQESSDVAGEAKGEVRYRAAGRLAGLGEGRTTLTLASLEAASGGLTVRNTQELPVVLGERVTELPRIALASTDGSVSATGSATVPGKVNLSLRFDEAKMGELARLIRFNFPLDGRLSGTVRVGGQAERPRIDAKVSARQGFISGLAYTKLSADIDYAPEQAGVAATLTLPPAQDVSVQGTVPVKVSLLPPAVNVVSGQSLIESIGRQAAPKLLEKLLRGLNR